MGPTHIPNNTELTDTGLTYEGRGLLPERIVVARASEADGHRELSEKEREKRRESDGEPTTKGGKGFIGGFTG